MDGKTPYEAWFGHKPNVSHFKVFGSKPWDRIPLEKRNSLQLQRKEFIMAVYSEYAKGYNLFDPSSQKTFIEISVQFEKEPMQEIKLVKGDCSHPPLNDDVSDDYSYDFSDSDIEDDFYHMHTYYDSPIRPKWVENTIQVASDLVGDPLDSRKTRSQFHNAFSICELNISNILFMMVGYDPKTYQEE